MIDLSPGLEVEQQSAPSFLDPGINQLMYVANQGNRTYNQPMLQQRNGPTTQQRPYQQQTKKLECFRCGGDHFVQDCPYEKPPLNQTVSMTQQFQRCLSFARIVLLSI